jgi:hypothetical protein
VEAPEQWRYLAGSARCSAFGSRCMKCDPFPSPTTKCSKTTFALGVKWASVGRGAAPCHWHWHQGQATRIWKGGQHPSKPAQAPRQSIRTRPNPPDAIHNRDVKSCKRWQRVLVRLSGYSKQLLWAMSLDHSRDLQGTNEHATMLASRLHIKLIFGDG